MQDNANDSVAASNHPTERHHNQFSLRRLLVMMFACSLACGIGTLTDMYGGSVMTVGILMAAMFVIGPETRRTLLIVLMCVYGPYAWWLIAADLGAYAFLLTILPVAPGLQVMRLRLGLGTNIGLLIAGCITLTVVALATCLARFVCLRPIVWCILLVLSLVNSVMIVGMFMMR